MHQRTPLILSATALAVAVLGATPLGHAAGERLAAAVPFAKSAGFAKVAGNAKKLNGRRSTLAGSPGTIPVIGRNGKLPASIGAVGSAGPEGRQGAKGDPGQKGEKGDKGSTGPEGPPGMSGWEVVTASSTADKNLSKEATAYCPTGKKPVGGGAFHSLLAYAAPGGLLAIEESWPYINQAWRVRARASVALAAEWRLTAYAICVNVAP
ncbi:MAG: hypothetical protein ACRELC_05975 [Gemmatimonadota bacterium]